MLTTPLWSHWRAQNQSQSSKSKLAVWCFVLNERQNFRLMFGSVRLFLKLRVILDVFSSQPISRFPHSCHTNDPSACTNSDWEHCFSLSSTLFTSLLLSGLLLHLFLPGWSQSAVGLERRRPLQVPSSTLPLPSSSTHCPLLPQGPAASLLTQVTLLPPPPPPPSSVRGFTV